MNALFKKLQVKGGSLKLVNKPRDVKLAAVKDKNEREVILMFVQNKAQLTRVPKKISDNQILWVAYPKGSSKVPTDLNRDILWKPMENKGFKGVSLIALDSTWSAMRFRL